MPLRAIYGFCFGWASRGFEHRGVVPDGHERAGRSPAGRTRSVLGPRRDRLRRHAPLGGARFVVVGVEIMPSKGLSSDKNGDCAGRTVGAPVRRPSSTPSGRRAVDPVVIHRNPLSS